MSIQSNINQGLSLMSLIVSQSPTAEGLRVQRKVEAEKPLREAEVELAREKTKAKTEERISAERQAEILARQEDIGTKTQIHTEHAKNIGEIKRTASGKIHEGSHERTLWEGHRSSREQAIKSGMALERVAPTPELRANIERWQAELSELDEVQKGRSERLRAKKAEDKAIEAMITAQERIRRARGIR